VSGGAAARPADRHTEDATEVPSRVLLGTALVAGVVGVVLLAFFPKLF
jgi:hypothetical protein